MCAALAAATNSVLVPAAENGTGLLTFKICFAQQRIVK